MNEFKSAEIFKKIYNIYNKLLSEVAKENNLTLNQLQILIFLNKSQKNNIAKNIVEELGVAKSHVSMSVTNLEQDGYIEKIQDEGDKKIRHLHLTTKADKAIEGGLEIQKKIKEIMFNGINDEEIKTLNTISKKIQDNLENYNKD